MLKIIVFNRRAWCPNKFLFNFRKLNSWASERNCECFASICMFIERRRSKNNRKSAQRINYSGRFDGRYRETNVKMTVNIGAPRKVARETYARSFIHVTSTRASLRGSSCLPASKLHPVVTRSRRTCHFAR